MNTSPNFFELVRAKFLVAYLFPWLFSSLLASHIIGKFSLEGFILTGIIGFALHISTNVYNDIYDFLQGADTKESGKSEFSGGSGLLAENKNLLSQLFLIARAGIVFSFFASIILSLIIPTYLIPVLWTIYFISAFFSKYYTAAPFKFAYRGLGEIVVFIGFGPLAIFLGAIGQGILFAEPIFVLAPLTGITTLFVVWMGQMLDIKTDWHAGKKGLVLRTGLDKAKTNLIKLYYLALLNTAALAISMRDPLFLIPFVTTFLIPKVKNSLKNFETNKTESAGNNFTFYALFSFSFLLSIILVIIKSFII